MGDKGKFDSWEIVSDTVAIKKCDKSFLSTMVQEFLKK